MFTSQWQLAQQRNELASSVLSGGAPLVGTALVSEIIEMAQSLPGYSEWCRHQHEITHCAEEWARCIEGSHTKHRTESLETSA